MKSTYSVFLLLLIIFGMISCKEPDGMPDPDPPKEPTEETFTFSTGDISKGKIYLPGSYETDPDLPVIYLIDFHEEQPYDVATDEFQQVINGVKRLIDFDAVIVSFATQPDTSINIVRSHDFFNLCKELAAYVDDHYVVGSSKTLIGRGSAGGMILLSLFQESGASHDFNNFIASDTWSEYIFYVNSLINSDTIPQDKSNMRLYYSFSDNYNLSDNNAMINKINEKNFSWLTFGSKAYPNLTFDEAYPQAFADGIAFAFR